MQTSTEQMRRWRAKYPERAKASVELYRKTHREHIKNYHREYMKRWRASLAPNKRKEIYRKQGRSYYAKHREKCLALTKKWMKDHPKQYAEAKARYDHIHKEQRNNWHKEWTKKHPEVWKKKQAKRRKLGFVEYNKFFKGSHAHHIDKIHVVYVPKDLHESVRHNNHTGRNMDRINARVFDWLGQNQLSTKLDDYFESHN